MKVLSGKGVHPGIAIGTASRCTTAYTIEKSMVSHVELEVNVFTQAAVTLSGELSAKGSDIATAQLFMLKSPEFCDAVVQKIKTEGVNAGYALHSVAGELASAFKNMQDEYFAARASDIEDIENQLFDLMEGGGERKLQGILIGQEIFPSQILENKETIQGLAMEGGGETSHACILARSLNIPCVIGVLGMGDIPEGETVVVNGKTGQVFYDLNKTDLKTLEEQKRNDEAELSLLEKYRGVAPKTADGVDIKLLCNLGSLQEIGEEARCESLGVGLFRSEFIFLDRKDLPGVEEQRNIYSKLTQIFGDREVTIRTLDAGADKVIPYLPQSREENPYLGVRGVRLCLKNPEVLENQLRAFAGVEGNLKVMVPMVSTVEEIERVREMMKRTGASFSLGVMVETPAAAVMADDLCKIVDFLSIGTNDLIQYTMAADRGNGDLAELYSIYQPSVLRLIVSITQAANKNGKDVSVCGEAASDALVLPFLIGAGIRKFSVTPSKLLQMKKAIRCINTIDAAELKDKILTLNTAKAIYQHLAEFKMKNE